MINQNTNLLGDREETQLSTWLLTAADGEGQPIENPLNADRTVTVVGDTGAFNSQTLQIQGSNDATSWFVLTTPTGTARSLNAAAIAGLFLTTEAVVADKPEKHAAPMGDPSGGMDF